MTDAELDAIQARCDAATPGPWWNESGVIHTPLATAGGNVHPGRFVRGVDAEFAAEARTDLPALVAEVRALRAAARAVVAATIQPEEREPDYLEVGCWCCDRWITPDVPHDPDCPVGRLAALVEEQP